MKFKCGDRVILKYKDNDTELEAGSEGVISFVSEAEELYEVEFPPDSLVAMVLVLKEYKLKKK